jgi:hypothetical protein
MIRLSPIKSLSLGSGLARFLLLAFVGAALIGTAARADATAPTGLSPQAHASAIEEEKEEAEEEESEEEIEVELEFEEGEEEESLPSECRLRTVTPRIVANFTRDAMRLSLRYTADSPLRASVAYWLKGNRGTARLGSIFRHLGRRGVVEAHNRLDGGTLAKLRAARVIVIQIGIPNTPSFCKRFLTLRLTAQRVFGRSATWFEAS